MNEKQKKEVMEKFKAKSKNKSEKDIIKNGKLKLYLGDTSIQIQELLWDDAEKLEDTVLEISEIFDNFNSMKIEELNPKMIIESILKKVMRQGLLDLAYIISDEKVTLEFIREHKIKKSEIIVLVVEGISLNYGYVKNLISLIR